MKTTVRSPIAPRKSPRQARSQVTVDTILDAAARILVERGYAATNTNLVAERAGVSVGSLYQYFPNKDSLIAALHDRHARRMDEFVERVLARCNGLTLDDALRSVITGLVDAHKMEAGLHRVLEMQLAGLDTLDDHVEVEAKISAQIRDLLSRYPTEIRVADLDLAIYVLMHSLHSLVHAVVYDHPRHVSLERATDEIVHLTRVYLTAAPAMAQATA
jgi:AcrR family transcriptional regulator